MIPSDAGVSDLAAFVCEKIIGPAVQPPSIPTGVMKKSGKKRRCPRGQGRGYTRSRVELWFPTLRYGTTSCGSRTSLCRRRSLSPNLIFVSLHPFQETPYTSEILTIPPYALHVSLSSFGYRNTGSFFETAVKRLEKVWANEDTPQSHRE